MPDKRLACLAIGVSNAPGLDYLGGAPSAARAVHRWATCSGYESILMIDDDDAGDTPPNVIHGPITVETMAAALEMLLPHGSKTDRLVVFFAGHGIIQELGEGLWVLNDWQDRNRVVSINKLRRALARYGVAQLSIMSDACCEIANTAGLLRLEPRGVLEGGFTSGDESVPTDRFIAALDGRATYMLPGATPEEDRCIFSGVLLEGLWGHAQACSLSAPTKVVSASLAPFLKSRSAEIAEAYKLVVKPDPQPGLYEPDNVYFDRDNPPNGSADLPVWPKPTTGIDTLERATAQAIETEATDSSGLESILGGLLGTSGMVVTKSLGSGIDLGQLGDLLGGILPKLDPPSRFPAPSPAPLPPTTTGDIADAVLRSDHPLSAPDRRAVEWLAERGRLQGAADAVATEMQRRETEIRALANATVVPSITSDNSTRKLTDGGVVTGTTVKAVWAKREVVVARFEDGQSWQVRDLPFGQSRQLLIEFEDGTFAPCVTMWGLATRLIATATGVGSIVYEPEYAQYDEIQRSIKLTIESTARLYAGTLVTDAATDLAIELRMQKHFNPVLGVLSAYLYDAIGDTDSIRRMAYYYAAHHQEVPYDIAYLANLPTETNSENRLIVRLAALKARKPRTDLEQAHHWTFEATREATTGIAGSVPWMRQGWTYLIAPSDAERMMANGLVGFGTSLLSAPFTTLDRAAGRALAATLDMEAVA